MQDKDATPIEAIDFESLKKPAEANEESKQGSGSKPILWFSFITLLLCAVVVFIFLPNYVENRKQDIVNQQSELDVPPLAELPDTIPENQTPKTITESVIEVEEFSPEELSALKQEVETLLLQLIDKQKLLNTKAVKKWAAEEFKIALALGTSGDEHFRKKEYKPAISSYQDAVKILNDLEQQISPTLAAYLEKGELALSQAEKETAIIHFGLAKDIEPENSQAINGLKRAQTINELYTLLQQGGNFEAANKFMDAKNTYQKATQLDPLSKEAQAALDRVSSRLAQNEFSQLMNQAYAALKAHQYGDARAKFLAAQKLAPSSNKPKQGIASIDQAIRDEKITALNAEAQHFENAQDWNNAAKTYQQILALSSGSSDAQRGLERNQKRKTINAKLDEHINNKLRLGSVTVANEAKLLLQEVESIDNPGSNIEQKALTLNELVRLANQAISITIQSDNQTDVAIYKVGKFGKFEQRNIDLKIGKYTIVGTRSGFRDVRKMLTVTHDMTSKIVQVHCDETI